MKIQDQVTNLEISKRIKKLGCKQKSLFSHYEIDEEGHYAGIILSKEAYWDYPIHAVYSAFTAAELGEMLKGKDDFPSRFTKKGWYCGFMSNSCGSASSAIEFYADTEADARGKFLIYLLENNLIKI